MAFRLVDRRAGWGATPSALAGCEKSLDLALVARTAPGRSDVGDFPAHRIPTLSTPGVLNVAVWAKRAATGKGKDAKRRHRSLRIGCSSKCVGDVSILDELAGEGVVTARWRLIMDSAHRSPIQTLYAW